MKAESFSDLGVIWQMLRGARRSGTQRERLEAFYRPQAKHYDRFRERLLHGRRDLIEALAPPVGGRVVELGAGTGRSVEFFGDRIDDLASINLVDLCPALLEQARLRWSDRQNVIVVHADATQWMPPVPVDCVYFSYALTMMPDWHAALENAFSMLKPGGVIGVVDFYVSTAGPTSGLVRHSALTRWLWPRWFAHDGVRLDAAPLLHLVSHCETLQLRELRAPLPYLPGLRAPYFIFIGRKRTAG